MNDKMTSSICSILSTMKADQRWSPKHDEAYLIGLEDLPDSIGPILRRELLRQWEWRPSVKELRDFASRLISVKDGLTADQICSELHDKIQRFGAYATPHPTLKNTYLPGPPEFSHPKVARVVQGLGGWATIATSDMPSGVFRGLLWKMAVCVLADKNEDAIKALRLEYQETAIQTLQIIGEELGELPDIRPERSTAALSTLGQITRALTRKESSG